MKLKIFLKTFFIPANSEGLNIYNEIMDWRC